MTNSTTSRDWQPIPGPLCADRLDVGNPSAHPLVLLHGFTQTRQSWDPLLDAFESAGVLSRPVIRVDLPGHGGSHDVVADLPTTADLVVETCGTGLYCGYSMGGRVALHIALRHPRHVQALITIGATAGITDVDERQRRRSADDALADTVERIGTEAFIEQWLAQPMFAGLPRRSDDLAQRHGNAPSGLAMSLRRAGTGTQEPLWSSLANLTMPVLLLAGDHDSKFSEIADQMAQAIGPHAHSARIPDAGHSAHLENPGAVTAEIASFMRSLT